MLDHAFKYQFSVAVLRHLLLPRPVWLLPPIKSSLRMRHQAEYRSFSVANSSYVVEGAVRVSRITSFGVVTVFVAVAENQHVLLFKPFKKFLFFFFREKEPSFGVCNGYLEHFAAWNLACEHTFPSVFLLEVDPAAIVALRNIRRQSSFRKRAYAVKTWEQAILNKNLKPVTDAQNQLVLFDESF